MKVLGFAGWSGSGKTTLICKLLPELARRGISVSTVKHTHHDIELDQPGKDSHSHRAAGAQEVLLVSPHRFALLRDNKGNAPPPTLHSLVARLAPVDLVLVEGFREAPCPKIEVHRPAQGKGRAEASNVVAVASDEAIPDTSIPRLDLNDVSAIADFIIAHAAGLPS